MIDGNKYGFGKSLLFANSEMIQQEDAQIFFPTKPWAFRHTTASQKQSHSPNGKKPLIAHRTGKKPDCLSLFFRRTSPEEQIHCEEISMDMGCSLLKDKTTGKLRVLHIPEKVLGCHLLDETVTCDGKPQLCLEEFYEDFTDSFILSLVPWKNDIKVASKCLYENDIIIDLLNDKIIRLEVVGASDLLDFDQE